MARANPFRFSTKYQDDESDLLYYGHRYCSANMGRWLSRDPGGESSGVNLQAFGGNDCCNDFDYIGLTVGTVDIVKSSPLPGWRIGWDIELRWHPPKEWNQQACMPCLRAVWIQDREYDIYYRWPYSLRNKDIHTGWGVDWDESNYQKYAEPWVQYLPHYSYADLFDQPEVGPWYKIKKVLFSAVAKVKCIEGPDSGLIYATVKWGYYDIPGDSVADGGYVHIQDD